MTIEAALWAGITADSGVSALISTRLYPNKLPQNPTYPAATYSRVATVGLLAHDGPVGFDTARFQFDYFGRTFSEARSVADAFRAYLEGRSGTLGAFRLGVIMFENEIDAWGETAGVFRLTQDYRVTYLR